MLNHDTENERLLRTKEMLDEIASYYDDTKGLAKEKVMEAHSEAIDQSGDEKLQTMKKIVERNVTNFKTDFYFHDYLAMKYFPDEPFLWLIRNEGTFLISLSDELTLDDETSRPAFLLNMYIQQTRIKRIFIVEEGKVKRITEEQARDIANRHQTKTLNRR